MKYFSSKASKKKVHNLVKILDGNLEEKNAPIPYSKLLKDNMENQTISKLYTDDKK